LDKKEFYVYGLTDPRNNLYFYIGKGKGNRYASHLKGMDDHLNKLKNDRIREIESEGQKVQIDILFSNLDEETAFELERIIIYKLGRQVFSEGILTNLVPGGKWHRDESVFYEETFNASFELSKLNPEEQKTFLNIKKISQFNYLNTSIKEQTIYKYENNGTFEIAIPLEDFFAGGVTKERIEILRDLRENELPIFYGWLYSKYPLKRIYISDRLPYVLNDVIDYNFNRRFDELYSIKQKFVLESSQNGITLAKVEKDGNLISFTSFYKSGKKRYFRQTHDGQPSGLSCDWYENGNIRMEKKYNKDGWLDYIKSFYDNGAKKSESSNTNGVKIDNCWHENGVLARQYVENMGTLFYNEKGIRTRTIWLEGKQPDKQIELDFGFQTKEKSEEN